MCKLDTPQGFLSCSYAKRGTESPDFVGSIPGGGELGANTERADRSALVARQSLGERPVWWVLILVTGEISGQDSWGSL